MKKLLHFYTPILFLSLMVACSTKSTIEAEISTAVKSSNQSPYKIVGYIAGWANNWEENFISAKRLTHINYAFANVLDGKVVEGQDFDSLNYARLNALREDNPSLKILYSAGGWSWSGNFSDAVLTQVSREVFAKSAIDLLKKYNLDGVDLDWEYPGLPGNDNTHRPEDKENFKFALERIREKLDSLSDLEGLEDGERYLLTIASGGFKGYLEKAGLDEAHQYLDFINIMTYDFHTGGSNPNGHHANLFFSDADTGKTRSADYAVELHIAEGIPADKLVLGVPFYGRGWVGANPTNNGRYQTVKGPMQGAGNITSLLDNYIDKNGFERFWDEAAKNPYLWNAETQTFITYEDPESLLHKCRYIKEKGLGGAMFWEYSHDRYQVLLHTLYENLVLHPEIDAENRVESQDYTEAVFTEGIEGPAVDVEGNLYVVNFQKQGTIGKLSPDGTESVFVELPEGSIGNGIRFLNDGTMVVADYTGHNILKIDPSTKSIETLCHEPNMNQPNDIAVTSQNYIFASDPDWENNSGQLWRISPNGGATLLESGMGTTNGIEVSPDEKTLYVNESMQRTVWAYDLATDGTISNKRPHIRFPDHGMDGMRCDVVGNHYITRFGKGTVAVVSPSGKLIKEIRLQGKKPTNIAFGGPGGNTCYVTLQDRKLIETFLADSPGREWAGK